MRRPWVHDRHWCGRRPPPVLTALHVVHPEPAPLIADRLAVTAIISLRPWQFGATRRLAQSSYQRTVILSGADDGTVDLALLAVPELRAPSLPTRRTPVRTGELVTVPGYPGGWRTASHGPITSADRQTSSLTCRSAPGSPVHPRLTATADLPA